MMSNNSSTRATEVSEGEGQSWHEKHAAPILWRKHEMLLNHIFDHSQIVANGRGVTELINTIAKR